MFKKLLIFTLICTSFSLCLFAGEKAERTVISCIINNFKRDMIYLDCPQTPFIRGEFHRNPGEEHILAFSTSKIVSLRLNGHELEFFLEPGDSLHAVINYGERLPQTITFSGSERAVRQNRLLWKLYRHRLSTRFKTSLNACVVLDHKPDKRIDDAKRYAEEAQNMIAQEADGCSEDFKNYVEAGIEALLGESLIYYPDLYAAMRHVPIEQQGIGDYWTLLDNWKIRSDEASLRCMPYMDFLIKYMVYEKAKSQKDNLTEQGLEQTMPKTLEGYYRLAEQTFDGVQLDAVLFTILTRYITEGKNIDEIDQWIADYKKRYNTNPEYLQILESLLQ